MTTVRRATLEDLDACFDVQKRADIAAFPHIFPPDEFPFPDDDVRERWRENLASPGRVCLCAADESGAIVGQAVLIDDRFDSVAVAPEQWGSSVASDLHDAVLATARAKGLAQLQLWVMEENHRARRFYERRGWMQQADRATLPFPPNPSIVRYTLVL